MTHVIHLAALQVPFCRADPPLGARVNVVGTVNVFEAVARRGDGGIAPVVYASSIAAYDALEEGAEPAMAGRAEHALRRLQAGQRGHRARSSPPNAASQRRPAPAHRLRRRRATRA